MLPYAHALLRSVSVLQAIWCLKGNSSMPLRNNAAFKDEYDKIVGECEKATGQFDWATK